MRTGCDKVREQLEVELRLRVELSVGLAVEPGLGAGERDGQRGRDPHCLIGAGQRTQQLGSVGAPVRVAVGAQQPGGEVLVFIVLPAEKGELGEYLCGLFGVGAVDERGDGVVPDGLSRVVCGEIFCWVGIVTVVGGVGVVCPRWGDGPVAGAGCGWLPGPGPGGGGVVLDPAVGVDVGDADVGGLGGGDVVLVPEVVQVTWSGPNSSAGSPTSPVPSSASRCRAAAALASVSSRAVVIRIAASSV